MKRSSGIWGIFRYGIGFRIEEHVGVAGRGERNISQSAGEAENRERFEFRGELLNRMVLSP